MLLLSLLDKNFPSTLIASILKVGVDSIDIIVLTHSEQIETPVFLFKEVLVATLKKNNYFLNYICKNITYFITYFFIINSELIKET